LSSTYRIDLEVLTETGKFAICIDKRSKRFQTSHCEGGSIMMQSRILSFHTTWNYKTMGMLLLLIALPNVLSLFLSNTLWALVVHPGPPQIRRIVP
jgi:hypothetical protein